MLWYWLQIFSNTQSIFWQHSRTYTFAVMLMSTYMDLWPSVQLSLIADNDEEVMGILADNSQQCPWERSARKPGWCLLAPSPLVLYLSSDKNIWQHKASLWCKGANSSNWQHIGATTNRSIWTKFTYDMTVHSLLQRLMTHWVEKSGIRISVMYPEYTGSMLLRNADSHVTLDLTTRCCNTEGLAACT